MINGEVGYYEWITMYYASYPSDDVFEIHESNLTNSAFGFNGKDSQYDVDTKKGSDVFDWLEDYTSDIETDTCKDLCIKTEIEDEADSMKFKGNPISIDQIENNHAKYVWKFLCWFEAKSGLRDKGDNRTKHARFFGYCQNHERCDLSGNHLRSYSGCDIVDCAGVMKEIDGVYYVILAVDDSDNEFTFSTSMSGEANSLSVIGSEEIEFYGNDALVILKGKFHKDEEQIAAEYKSSSGILQKGVSTWYKALRRIALVILLSILVYIGIRIIISSTAQDKAKYKKMIVDWVAAICILYILHFLMAGALAITSELSLMFGAKEQELIYAELPSATRVWGNEIGGDGYWAGSFMGYSRFVAGFDSNVTSMAYALIYIILVFYTVMFTFVYLKRVIYMAFLTMISPLIAVTYPIDKIKDGNAQAFGLWIREFVFNALLQPVHLVLYVILIGNCMDLAVDYPLYAILALGFMMPAEKFLRKMFGFEKAGTVSQLGAAAGGALVGNALGKIGSLGRGIGNMAKSGAHKAAGAAAGAAGGGEGGSGEGGGNIRTVNNTMMGGNSGGDASGGTEGREISGGDASGGNSSDANSGNNNGGYDSRLTQEQREELIAECIEPGDPEYSGALANYGIKGEDPNANSSQASQTEKSEENSQSSENIRENENTQSASTPPQNLKNSASTSKGRSVLKGIGYAGRGLAQTGRYGVRAAGIAGKLVLGGAGAMLGAAAGIASGEGIGGALKGGMAGAAAGGAVASGATNLAMGAIDGAENLATRGANAVKGAYANSKESKDAYNGIKDSKARDLARDMNLSPEVAGLAHRIATSISADALYDDDALKKMIASSGADSATQKQMLEYIKRFR